MKEYIQVVDQMNQSFEKFKALVINEIEEAEELANFSLTPQQELIMFYIIRNHPVTGQEIASYLDITKSAISQVLPKLEAQNLIIRQTNPKNRRESLIFLGERGKEYVKFLERIDLQMVEKYYSKIPLEDLKFVNEVLKKLVEEATKAELLRQK